MPRCALRTQRGWFTKTSLDPSANVWTSENLQCLEAGHLRGVVTRLCRRPSTTRERGRTVKVSERGAISPCRQLGDSTTTMQAGFVSVVWEWPWARMYSFDV